MTRFLAVVGTITLGGGALVLAAVAWFFLNIPDPARLKKCLVTEMYKVNLCPGSKNYVTLDQISPYVVGAVIMSEDAAFFSHDGIDINEMKESMIRNLNEGRYARGGSTITQQLAKNVFLNGEKSILRKVEEIYLAFKLEKIFTKNQILTSYLNVVEFAPNVYGIRAGSQYYFHKEPSQLTPEEGAFLAFLLPNPKKYSQSYSKKQLTPFAYKIVRTILHKMLMGKKITQAEYDLAKANVGTLFGGSSAQLPAINETTLDDTIPTDVDFSDEPTPSDSDQDGEFKYNQD
jgi:monofunctional biosynthetic peptidoglycan transglycosylase